MCWTRSWDRRSKDGDGGGRIEGSDTNSGTVGIEAANETANETANQERIFFKKETLDRNSNSSQDSAECHKMAAPYNAPPRGPMFGERS